MSKCCWSAAASLILASASTSWAQAEPPVAEPMVAPASTTDTTSPSEPVAATPEAAPESAARTSEAEQKPVVAPPPTPVNDFPSYFQPGLLMQGWLYGDRTYGVSTTTMRLRRSEIYASGKVIPDRVSYLVMFDLARVMEPKDTTITVDNQNPAAPADGKPESVTVKQPKTAVSTLQDYYMRFETEFADIYFGQFKIPVSYDGSQTPAYALLMPDRSTPTIYFDDRRDIGFKVTKGFKYLRYTVAVFNGAGQNTLDDNNAKDVALRFDFMPFAGFGVGAVGYYTLAQVRHKAANDRYEADVHYEGYGLNLQAEYMQSHIASVKTGLYTDARGGYAMAAYRIAEVFQPVVRISYLDPDIHKNLKPKTQADLDEYWQYEGGLNYYLKGNTAKLQATVGQIQYQNKHTSNQFLAEAQVWY